MTAVLSVTCDRCGRLVDSGRTVVTIEAGTSPPSWPTSVATGHPSLDLCPRGLDALVAWLASPRQDRQNDTGTTPSTSAVQTAGPASTLR
jgi:hypothetical protein